MTNHVVTALRTLLKTFEEEGLLKMVAEILSEAAACIRVLSERLSKVNQLYL